YSVRFGLRSHARPDAPVRTAACRGSRRRALARAATPARRSVAATARTARVTAAGRARPAAAAGGMGNAARAAGGGAGGGVGVTPGQKRVCVTSLVYAATAAPTVCQSVADSVGLGGTWVA